MLRRWRVKRAGSTYKLNLPGPEREVILVLCGQLKDLISTPPDAHDERMTRLFPTAYADDPERDAEYRHYMHDELVTSRLASIEMVEETVAMSELSESQLMGWMRAVNSIRLVLGTLLDVSEETDVAGIDDDHPDIGHYALYAYLSALLEEIVAALG
jgi:hypothetical protein